MITGKKQLAGGIDQCLAKNSFIEGSFQIGRRPPNIFGMFRPGSVIPVEAAGQISTDTRKYRNEIDQCLIRSCGVHPAQKRNVGHKYSHKLAMQGYVI